MQNENIKKIQKQLEKDLYINENKDFIGQLFEKRKEEMQKTIINSSEYNEHKKILKGINEQIQNKFKNNTEIITAIEQYENEERNMDSIYEKIMYKLGVYDAITLITKGNEPVDINECIKENYNSK